jgi:hypothetical protein
LLRFQVLCHIFTNLLDGSGREQLAGNFHSRQRGRIDPPFSCIFFVDIQADRPVSMAYGVQGVVLGHTLCKASPRQLLQVT